MTTNHPTPNPYSPRVAKGAALLDRVRPGWARQVAPEALCMESCDSCVLGQLYGHYDVGWWAVVRPLPAWRLFSTAAHGFTLRGDEQDTNLEPRDVILGRFAVLADAWRDAIRERVAAGVPVETSVEVPDELMAVAP